MLKGFYVVGLTVISLTAYAFAAPSRFAAVVSGKELLQVFIYPRAPEYPYEAQRNGWSGRGVYRAFVTPDGKVSRVMILHSAGHSALDDVVIRAALQWRARSGRAKEVDFPIIFVLPR
jgi:TonB family protein